MARAVLRSSRNSDTELGTEKTGLIILERILPGSRKIAETTSRVSKKHV